MVVNNVDRISHNLLKAIVPTISTLCGFLSRRHGVVSGCGWRRGSPEVEGSCESIE